MDFCEYDVMEGKETLAMENRSDDEFTLEIKEKAKNEVITYFYDKFKDAVVLHEQYRKKFENWKKVREHTIRKLEESSEIVTKECVVEEESLQIKASTVASIAGKGLAILSPLFSLTTLVAGVAVGVLGEGAKNICSEKKQKTLKLQCDLVRHSLELDAEITMNLYHLLQDFRKISTDIKECVDTFHSSVMKDFFVDVPALHDFAEAAKKLNVRDEEGFLQFIHLLFDWIMETDFNGNPERLDQNVARFIFPEVFLEINSYSKEINEMEAPKLPESCTKASLKGLNAFSVVHDIFTLCNNEEYSDKKFVEAMKETKKKLVEEYCHIIAVLEKLI